jgi:glycosyltransferase involved in cell wall biosynthesis
MKKILFLSPLPPPLYGSAMSSEMCLDILKSDKRFDVQNVKLNYSGAMSDVGKLTLSKLYGIIIVIRQIRHLIKNFNPEIIYFMPALSGFALLRDYLFLRIIKTFNRRKLILHIRTQIKREDFGNPLKKIIFKGLLQCDKVIVLGPELVENLNGEVTRNKIFILPNAIPNTLSNKEFEKINNRKNKNTDLNLLFLSNLEESKGCFKLLEVCKLLYDAGEKYTCHFVGDWRSDNERQRFFRYIEKYNLSGNIIYHGRLISKEKKEMLTSADILIFPTENDACPRVIIEAMEFGLPVISTRVGTIPSLIEHGKTGFILEKNQATEIFDYVIKLQDKNFRNEIGFNGRKRFLEKFTLDLYKNKFIGIINED